MSDRLITMPLANPQDVNPPTSTAHSDAQLTNTSATELDASKPTLSNKEAAKSPLDATTASPTAAGTVLEHSAPEIRGQSASAPTTTAKSIYITSSISALKEAALKGDAVAQFDLGKCFHEGVDVQVNHEEALKWYTQSAEQGYFKAQHNLSLMYYNGVGVKKDHTKAADWLNKALTQGLSQSQFYLASLYANGDGVPKNDAVAFSWYLKAAD